MTDICMLTCNRKRITETAIRELRRRTTTAHQLRVLDNGSTDGTLDALTGLVDEGVVDVLYTGDGNRGVHWGFNRLLELAETNLYVCADNDLIPQVSTEGGDWLGLLIDLMKRHPDYAAIACLPHYLIGDNLESWLQDASEIIERSWCGAALRIMRAEAVREVGSWRDTQDPSRNNEERWICGKLRGAGWKVGYSRDVRCIHLWGLTDQGEDPWGYPIGFEHGHREIWPPPDHYNWDRLGVDWETCKSRGRLVP
jgi:GT2 family glycosyltransferase